MSDTGSALAINEKKTQRTGGCVGIFFQFFDWKKRLAKKKFFPNKLLSLGQHSFSSLYCFSFVCNGISLASFTECL